MILGLDAAAQEASVALIDPAGRVVAERVSPPGSHGEDLLGSLLALLAEDGLELSVLIGIGVGLGPGSFTGLRAAMSVAKGIVAGRDLPVVGVPSLGAWLDAEPEAVGALSRAGSAEAHLLIRGERESRLVGAGDLPAGAIVRPLVAPADVAAMLGLERPISPAGSAAAIARAAQVRINHGAPDDPAALEPLYGRLPRGVDQLDEAAVTWL